MLIKMKFHTAEEVSRIITDEEFSESDDVVTVLMPCPLDERKELH